jgi:hypothetical protein
LFVLIFSFWQCLCAQRSLSAQAQDAILLFDDGKFIEAQNEFSKLVQKYPKDWLYQYYLGACMVETNKSFSESVELLKYAATKIEHPGPRFYLALASFYQYRFGDAIRQFELIKKDFKRNQVKSLNIEKLISQITATSVFYSHYIEIGVAKKQIISTDSIGLDKIISIRKIVFDGDSVSIISSNLKSWVPGELYYFSAKIKNKPDYDIYSVRFESDSSWAKAELVPGVNTNWDEINPFFDYNSKTLYFASTREDARNGFDIFKSNYDSGSKRFGKITMLPFPLNSLRNDLLYVVTDNEAILYSSRETPINFVTRYNLITSKPQRLKSTLDEKIIATIALLNVNQAMPLPQVVKESAKEVVPPTVEKTEPIEHTVQAATAELKLATSVLQAQIKADSVMLEIQYIKDKLVNTDDKELRNKLFATLRKQEKQAIQMQNKADELYVQLIANDTSSGQRIKSIDEDSTVLVDFQLSETSPYSAKNPFILNYIIPKGVIYRIQLGVYSKPVNYDFFKGIQPISAEFLQEGKLVKYFAGVFNRFAEADSSLSKIKALGYKEAFITSYLDSQKIPIERAKDLEINK